MNVFKVQKVLNSLEKRDSFQLEKLRVEFEALMQDLEEITNKTSQKAMRSSENTIAFIAQYIFIMLAIMTTAKYFFTFLKDSVGLSEQFSSMLFIGVIIAFVTSALFFFFKVFEPYMVMRKHKKAFDKFSIDGIDFKSETAKNFLQEPVTLGEMTYALKTLGLFYAMKIIEIEELLKKENS